MKSRNKPSRGPPSMPKAPSGAGKARKVSFGEIFGLANPDGYPETGVSLMVEPPGANAECLLYSASSSLAEQGYFVIFLCVSKPAEIIEEEANSLGFDFSGLRKAARLCYIDCHSALFGLAPSEISLFFRNSGAELDLQKSLDSAISGIKGKKFAVLDSLSTILDVRGPGSAKGEVAANGVIAMEFLEFCSKKRIGLLGLLTDWNYPQESTEGIFGNADCIAMVSFSGSLGTLRPCILITKPFLGRAIPFRISRQAPPRPVIPKIVVVGPRGSGKTSLIYSTCKNAATVKGTHVTIEMDQGEASIGDFDYLLLSSQPEEFEHFLSIFGNDIAGAAIVVNASATRSIAEAAALVQKAGMHCVPFVVIANRLGSKAASEKIIGLLGLEDRNSFFISSSSPPSSEYRKKALAALSFLAGKAYSHTFPGIQNFPGSQSRKEIPDSRGEGKW